MSLTLIGDLHGRSEEYRTLVSSLKTPSVQLGDFGIGMPGFKFPIDIDPYNHKFIGGNHDNPDICNCYMNYLGRYGMFELGGIKFFFVSGAKSIDMSSRVEGRNWWKNEELSLKEWQSCSELFEETKPDIVLSHDCPQKPRVLLLGSHHIRDKRSTTVSCLSVMHDYMHKPALWCFGHHHVPFDKIINKTRFVCVPTLETFVIG